MRISYKARNSWLIPASLVTAPVLLLAILFLTDPFKDILAQKTIPLSDLSGAQRMNVSTAAAKLNESILKPGHSLSFNNRVGPRTCTSGFQKAPAYLGQDNQPSPGGGICLVSSALYQAALESGLEIVERHPHTRPISSAPPGLDATVWWGAKDLIVRNQSSEPVKLVCLSSPNKLSMIVKGRRTSENQASLRRLKTRASKSHLQIEVYRKLHGKELLVSRDLYRLGTGPLPPDQTGNHNQNYQACSTSQD